MPVFSIDRDAKEKAKHEIKVQPIVEEPVIAKPEPKKQSGTKFPLWGFGVIVFAVLTLVVWELSSLPASPRAATSTATIAPVPILDIDSTGISPKDGMTLLYVPEGKFLMGSTDADTLAFTDEKPQHPVTLKAFWIDQTEVTNQLFSAFVSATGYQTDAEKAGSSYVYSGSSWTQTNGADWHHPTGSGSDISGKEKYPVIHVSWNDAVAYCEWSGRRLPTEAEWEKAASWNDLTQEKYIYPWGNDFNGSIVNFCDKNCVFDLADKNSDDGFAGVSPTKNYPNGASPYGAYDMAGNVWEWVNDWYQSGYYATLGDSASNPQGPSSGDGRVLRGGSWLNGGSDVRSASRYWNYPSVTFVDFGFRCARSLP